MTPSANALAVLIVDDNRDGSDTLAQLLAAYGHEARAVYSAREAGRVVLDGFVPDAVLLDLGLPGTDGFDVARELCAALPRRPLLVAVTGFGNLGERCRREGFDHYYLKPVDPAELLESLTACPKRRTGVLVTE